MSITLKPYFDYKNSGVRWLGQVPERWAAVPLKRLAWFKSGAGFPVDEQGQRDLALPFFKVSDMNLPGNERAMRAWNNAVSLATANRLGATVFPAGTIVFPKVGGAMLTNKRRVVERPCCIDNNLMGCVVRQGDPRFVLWLLQTIDFATIAKPGPVPAISESEVREIRVTFPPLPEQASIVRFLDHAGRCTRQYIHAKQKLIKLLEEQKQSIIHRIVTRGVDPNVRLKSSGMEWLGDVPEQWEVKRAKWYYREIDERSATGSEELLSVSHITGVTRRSEKNVTMFMAESYAGHKLCREGDIIINTMWAWMAALGVARQTGIVSPSYAVYRPISREAFLPTFIDKLLRTEPYVAEYVCRSTGIRSSRLRLYPEQFLNIPLVRPPLIEQHAILNAIAHATSGLDCAIRSAQHEISLLREYSTSLIADVVTGKLDVRDAAGRLPTEVDGVETLDAADELDEVAESDSEEVEPVVESEEI